MQASNFGGTFDQLFLWIFYEIFTEDASRLRLHHGAKKSKKDQKLKSRGPALNLKARVSSFIVSVAGLQLKHN